jgi:hypothetical protein
LGRLMNLTSTVLDFWVVHHDVSVSASALTLLRRYLLMRITIRN